MDAGWWQSGGATFALIAFAEIGDKSQLACMMLAAQYGRARPVLIGATAAFGLLNTAAVLFGAALALWLPKPWVLGAMAILFTVFGLRALLYSEDEDDGEGDLETRKGYSLLLATFLMILVAEMGDKTQIAVAGMAGVYPATAVWTGATIALILTSAAGVIAGKTVLRRLPVIWMHRIAGALFLALAGIAVWRLLQP